MTTTETETMLRVTWKDSKGTRLAEATTYSKLTETLAMIDAEGGELIGVRKLEQIPVRWRGIR